MTTATSRRALVVLALAILVAAGSVTAPVAPMAATASEPEPAVSDAPAAQGRTRVQQGAVVFTPSYIDVYVALARGYFAEQGLDVESTAFQDPGTARRAFVSGGLDFANS